MRSAASIIREARRTAGLTQKELAERMGTTQSAVARLEARGANPRLKTLEKAVRATGRHLEVDVSDFPPGNVDETLIARQLRLTPSERLESLEHMYGEARVLAEAGERARGELA
jgi:transcriptional regulator with XRE-family HTH domain